MSGPELTRPVPVTFREDGCVEGITCLSSTEFKIRAEIQTPPSRVIPVIVVPGIMGSNLRKAGDPRVKVWRPPNGGGEGAQAGISWGLTGAAARQSGFIPDEAEVDPTGPVIAPPHTPWLNEAWARETRGWGTVHLDSYGGLLVYLETHLNRVYRDKKVQGEWVQMQKHQDA